MKNLFVVLLIFAIASTSFCVAKPLNFNIVSYGATGNGQTDDTQVYFFYFRSHTLFIYFFHIQICLCMISDAIYDKLT